MCSAINREFVFLAGLPRSGSTVLANIFAQNPKLRSDGITSGLPGLISLIKENWEKVESFRAWPDDELRKRTIKAVFESFYTSSEHQVIIDKNRAWPSHIETLELILGKKPKVIACVRDMRAIMASWEKLWRKNRDIFSLNIPVEAQHTVESRVAHWGSSKDHTGKAYLTLQDALTRGHKDCMLFVDFDKLTRDPHFQLARIYEFIGIENFEHDFNNIQQQNLEADPVTWMKDLHLIRPKLKAFDSNWEEILGPQANGLATSNKLWEDKI